MQRTHTSELTRSHLSSDSDVNRMTTGCLVLCSKVLASRKQKSVLTWRKEILEKIVSSSVTGIEYEDVFSRWASGESQVLFPRTH